MVKRFSSVFKLTLATLFVLALIFTFAACSEEEPSATPTAAPESTPSSTFAPSEEIEYDPEEFHIVDTTIVEYLGKGGDVVIPEKVTAIGDMAFSNRSDVTSITFTKDITTIGAYAFENCTGFTGPFTPPNNLNHIGDYAFAGCTGITEFIFQNKLQTVGTNVFYGCTSLQKSNCPDTMLVIPDYFFYGCSSLKEVEIGTDITEVGESAFYGCSSLEKIVLPNKITTVGSFCFGECTALADITYPSSLYIIGDKAFDSTKWFADAYAKASAAEADTDRYILVGQGTVIAYVPASENDLLVLDLPDTAYSIAEGAFDSFVDRISEVQLSQKGSKLTYIGVGVFEGAVNLKEFLLPNRVSVINDNLFAGCVKLENIDISQNKITYLGSNAFYGCESLETIVFCDTITTIGDNAFYGCTSLTEVNLPDAIQSIGDYAFINCTSLERVIIPLKLSTIGVKAFDATPWYDNLSNYDVTPTENQFHIYGDGILIKADIFEDTIVIPEEVKLIASFTFNGWKEIGDREFYGSSLPYSVTIPEGVTSIGDYAFYYCTNLQTIFIPESVESIGEYAFYGCSSIKFIDLPTNLTEIKDYTFYGCTNLESVTLPANLQSIGKYAFYDCYKITELEIPATVTYVGAYAFINTTWHYYNTDDFVIVGDGVLIKVNAIGDVVIPAEVKAIAGGAFDSDFITSIVIPEGITLIDEYTFSGCTAVTKITLPSTITKIGYKAFNNCFALEEVNIPAGVEIDETAFNNCPYNK